MKGMETGPLSYTSLFYSLGLIVPVIFGLLFWGEKMGMLQVIGLLLLLITIYLGSGSKSPTSPEKGMNLRWLVFTLVAFLGNGFLMTITKAHQVLLPGKQVMEFLFICFSTATVSSFLLAIIMLLLKKQDTHHLKDRNFVLVVIGTGITTAVGNMIMFILAGRMDGVVLYPVVCGGVVVLSSIASLILFKEKLAGKGFAGLAIGMAALVMLSLK
jgi:drug/metabolite transporter (DMT)-like permease